MLPLGLDLKKDSPELHVTSHTVLTRRSFVHGRMEGLQLLEIPAGPNTYLQ
jgi:hypothetical protein